MHLQAQRIFEVLDGADWERVEGSFILEVLDASDWERLGLEHLL